MYDYGEPDTEFPTSARDDYRRKYYEALDLLISAIKSRFLQPSLQVYQNLETLLLKSLQDDDIEDQTQSSQLVPETIIAENITKKLQRS